MCDGPHRPMNPLITQSHVSCPSKLTSWALMAIAVAIALEINNIINQVTFM